MRAARAWMVRPGFAEPWVGMMLPSLMKRFGCRSFAQQQDGNVYDAIPEVAARYLGKRGKRKQLEVWKTNRQVRFMRTDGVLRVQGETAFTLRWSSDDWKSIRETRSIRNVLTIDYADLSDITTSPWHLY